MEVVVIVINCWVISPCPSEDSPSTLRFWSYFYYGKFLSLLGELFDETEREANLDLENLTSKSGSASYQLCDLGLLTSHFYIQFSQV